MKKQRKVRSESEKQRMIKSQITTKDNINQAKTKGLRSNEK